MISSASIWRDFYMAGLRASSSCASRDADMGLARFKERFDISSLNETEYLQQKLMEWGND